LKALTLLKFGWAFSSLISMGVTIGFYSMLFGWVFALEFIALLLIHEMGHFIWMKGYGLNPKAPMFIPGVGAFVAMRNMPGDEATHAWVAYAGPLVGAVGSAAFYWTGAHMDNSSLMAAGSTGFLLNLLQLVPAKPLDGGFIISAINKWLLIPGTLGLIALSFAFHSVLFLVISLFSAINLFKQFSRHKSTAYLDGPPVEAPATVSQRIAIGIAYLSLTGMLGYLYWLSHSELISLVRQ
jgi:Zn-dependent protease